MIASSFLALQPKLSLRTPPTVSSSRPNRRCGTRCVIHENVTSLIGDTPCVKISDKLAPEGVDVYVKCEFFNPLSSVKDRLALAVIEDAEKSGKLKPGQTVVEATSGNTGAMSIFLFSLLFATPFDKHWGFIRGFSN